MTMFIPDPRKHHGEHLEGLNLRQAHMFPHQSPGLRAGMGNISPRAILRPVE